MVRRADPTRTMRTIAFLLIVALVAPIAVAQAPDARATLAPALASDRSIRRALRSR